MKLNTTPSLTLWLVRHGESEQNSRMLGGPGDDWPDHAVPLTERGAWQAAGAAEALSCELDECDALDPDRTVCYVSPYLRAQRTANALAKRMRWLKIYTDDMLAEQDFGLFDGLLTSEIREKYPDEYAAFRRSRKYNGKFFARRPNGESPLDVEVRQRLFLKNLEDYVKAHPMTRHVIVVGHGAQLTVLRKTILGESHVWYEKQPNPGNASIQKLTVNEKDGPVDRGYAYGGPGRNEADGDD